jgi:hypothetical protein
LPGCGRRGFSNIVTDRAPKRAIIPSIAAAYERSRKEQDADLHEVVNSVLSKKSVRHRRAAVSLKSNFTLKAAMFA